MALVESRSREEQMRRSFWDDDRWMRDWDDWPLDWPQPRELVTRFRSDFDRRRGFLDWPSDWPTMDAVVPRFSSHLDRMDRNWRSDPFWRDLYPRWAEPIFKEGIDIKTKITNDYQRFAVEVDAYQFRPEEIQVKTVDNTLLIEGRHEDVRDRDNFTKMYFVRKYQLPADIEPADVCSSIDSTGRLTVEAMRRQRLASGRERLVPIEGPSRRGDNRGQQRSSSSNSPRERDRSESETYRNETQGGMESREKHQCEYRSEASNGYRSESRSLRRDEYHNDGSLDRNRYRVDSPSTSSRQNGVGDTAKSESRSSVRSVQILRKTFQ